MSLKHHWPPFHWPWMPCEMKKWCSDREKSAYFSGIIKEENRRMNKQVETILQAALIDRQELQLKLQPLHVNEVIRRVHG